MRNIHNHMQALHLGHKFTPDPGQAGRAGVFDRPGILAVIGGDVRAPQAVLVVPGQGHHPHAEAVEIAQNRKIVATDCALLNRQHRADAPVLAQLIDIRRAFHPDKVVGVGGEQAVEKIGLPQR